MALKKRDLHGMEEGDAKPDPQDSQQNCFALQKLLVDIGCKKTAEERWNSNDCRDREVIHESPSVAMGVKKSDPRPHQDPEVRPKETDGDGDGDDDEEKKITHRDPPMRHRC
jgi:hypothetical protein